MLNSTVSTVLLLVASNTFMTIAWYGHLKHADKAFWVRILVSWLIALPEYALQVPANAIGAKVVSPTVLKIIQEVISLGVFVAFAWWYFGEAPTWRTLAAFALVAAAVALIATGRPARPATAPAASPGTPPASAACPPGAGLPPPARCPSAGV
jgi:uncharacterized protein (DUF486 family)